MGVNGLERTGTAFQKALGKLVESLFSDCGKWYDGRSREKAMKEWRGIETKKMMRTNSKRSGRMRRRKKN